MKVCKLKEIQRDIFEVHEPINCPDKIRTDKGVLIAPFPEFKEKGLYNYFDYEAQQYHNEVQQSNVLFLQKLFNTDWKSKEVTIDAGGYLQLLRHVRAVIRIDDTRAGGTWNNRVAEMIALDIPFHKVNSNYETDKYYGTLYEIYLHEFYDETDELAIQQYTSAYSSAGCKLEYFQQL